MRGLVPPAPTMPGWARALVTRRREGREDETRGLAEAIEDLHRFGTSAVGDISNTLASAPYLERSLLRAVVFNELIGFASGDAPRLVEDAVGDIQGGGSAVGVRLSLAAHAPYSVSPALFRALAAWARSSGSVIAVHLGESIEELAFLRNGTGEWRALLQDLGAWDDGWVPPGCGPVEYLERLGWSGLPAIAVHAVHLTDDELSRLGAWGATVVACPRSNAWTGAGSPRLDRMYAAGVRVALGTDSLASVASLNLFAEMAEVRRLAPDVPAARILRSATLDGAEGLGCADLGRLSPGASDAVIAVAVPAGVSDVEEYLLSGITADGIRWIGDGGRRGPAA